MSTPTTAQRCTSPGSHHYRTFAEVPPDPVAHMVPFPAAAGSLVIIYLMCAGYTTGQVLQVDGAWAWSDAGTQCRSEVNG